MSIFGAGWRIPASQVNRFTRDLAVLQGARIPLVESLALLAGNHKGTPFGVVLLDLIRRLKGGASLADAMAFYPDIFDEVYRNLVRVGEMSGQLAEVLNRAARHREKMANLKRKLRQALTYPALVLAVAIGAVVFILTVVLPTFTEVFRDFSTTLPRPTRILILVSNWFTAHWLPVLFSGVLAVFTLRMAFRFRQMRYFRDWLWLTLPLLGPLVRKNLVGQFCKTLGTLLSCRVAMLTALRLAGASVPNLLLGDFVTEMARKASRGGGLTGINDRHGLMPGMVMQMIAVGEETADLPAMLEQIGAWYDEEIDRSIDLLATVLEPLIILFLGAVIGVILIAI